MSGLAKKLSTRKLRGPEQEPIILQRRRIYILPTRYGALLSFILALMLIGSINYNNSLGFALTFLIGSVALISMLHAHRNLAGLQLRCASTQSVFAGQNAQFPLLIRNPKAIDKISIRLGNEQCKAVFCHIEASSTMTVNLSVAAPQRGKLFLSPVKISTEYPLSLFHAWSWIHLPCACIIYPAAEKNAPPPEFEQQGQVEGYTTLHGQEEFSGLRHYIAGDAIKSIAWKQSARGSGTYTKQFTGGGTRSRWLKWDITGAQSMEQRLSRLCQWIIQCENNHIEYGMKIPGKHIPPGCGHQHRHRCLAALALFGKGT